MGCLGENSGFLGMSDPCSAGSQLQEPPSQPRGVPGQHEAAAHHRGLALEHAADRPVGPGWCQAPSQPRISSPLGCLNPKNPILGGWEGPIRDKASLETPKLGTGTSPAMVPRGKAVGLSPDTFIARLLIGIFPLLRRIWPCPSSRRRSTGSRGCSSPSTTRTPTCCTWLARCARRGRGPGAAIGVFVRPRPQPNPNPALLPRSLQGDGNIRYYEIGSEKPYLSYLMEFRSPAPQKGLGKDCRAARPPLPNPNVPKVAGRKCLIKRCR